MDGRLLIANTRVETREKLVSKSPSTLEAIGEISLAGTEECRRAVRAAAEAFPGWKAMPVREREKIFRRARAILLERSGEIARLISLEKGSPTMEAMSVELLTSLESLDYYAHNLATALASRKARPQVPLFTYKKNYFVFQPLGTTLVISPWNFPFVIPFYDVLSALASGNTVVLRPSTATPFIALKIGEIFMDAGLPPGVLNVVNCRSAQAEEMITDPVVQTVMFTGSVPIGKRIMELCSRNLTNVVLELGGKDPMIVMKDADLERAARGAVWAGFMNTGQSCASVERVYVAREIADAFTSKVVELTGRIKVGDPLAPGTELGPMVTSGQRDVVEDHLRDAREKGASILCGGERSRELPGYFLTPAVVTGVNHRMKIMMEETFGPVLPIMPFDGAGEALALANDCAYGLTASVWTRNKGTAAWLAERLEAGTVTVNDHMFSFTEPQAIWGGIKQTGMGRSHGPFGLHHLQNIKFVSEDFIRKKGQFWWYPYDAPKPQAFENAIRLLHHERPGKKLKAAWSLLAAWPILIAGISVKSFIPIIGRFFRKKMG
jgi:acyl-CoA reductase-like NAD-dependent aldehyde dehydrogenase